MRGFGSSPTMLGLVMLLWSAVLSQPAQAQRPSAGVETLHWKCSTQDSSWTDKPDVPISHQTPVPTAPRSLLLVNSRRREQVIDGWGGCFNERGWKALEALPAADRDQVMQSLFSAQTGLKLNLCRTPIGASDYAISLYSLDETPGDYAMQHFRIDRDKERLIPYIKAALAIRPDLSLWAVPWSPPSWMKDNNSLVSGHINDDDKTLDALALYFSRYLQAYKAAGISIGMVMPQNEPTAASNYSSCLWTGEQMAKFVGFHLGPQLQKDKIPARIFLGTFNDASRGGYAYWVGPSLQNPQVRRYVAGVGCQWDGYVTMTETHFLFPDLKLMQSEAECGSTNSNDWAFAEHQYQLAHKWFGAGAGSNMIWNLVLTKNGDQHRRLAAMLPDCHRHAKQKGDLHALLLSLQALLVLHPARRTRPRHGKRLGRPSRLRQSGWGSRGRRGQFRRHDSAHRPEH